MRARKKRYFYTRNVHIGMFTCLWIGSLNIDNIAIDIPIDWMDQVDQAMPWMDVFCLPVIDRASTCQKLLPEANSTVSFLFDIFRTLFVQKYIHIYPSNPPISPRLFHLSMCDVFALPPQKNTWHTVWLTAVMISHFMGNRRLVISPISFNHISEDDPNDKQCFSGVA